MSHRQDHVRALRRTAAEPAAGLLAQVLAVGSVVLLIVLCAAPVRVAAAAGPDLRSGQTAQGVRAGDVADRKQTLDRQLDDLREELEGTSQSLIEAAVDLKRAQSHLLDANAELAGARAQLAAAAATDLVLADRLTLAEAAVAKADRQLRARRTQEVRTRQRLGGLAREAYTNSGLSGLSIALDAASPQQFADRVNVAGTALRQQNSAIARLQVQQAETRARQARLGAAQDVVRQLKQQSEEVLGQRRQAERAAARATGRIGELIEVRARSVRAIAARKAAEKRRLDAVAVEQKKLATILQSRARARARAEAKSRRAKGAGHSRAGSGTGPGPGRLSYPLAAPVTSGFGWRRHPILHILRLHAGTDFGAGCGTPVRAAGPGTIVRAGRAGGYGNQMVIDHGRMRGRNVATTYNHLSRFVVRSGTVRRGQVVAYSGTTGLSTGCHLHFEVLVNGTPVNPMNWLAG